MDLKNKLVLITGATSGIGKALSYKLAEKNCKLSLIARSADKLETCKNELAGLTTVNTYKCDVSSRLEVNFTIDKIKEEQGLPDVAILNAGISLRTAAVNVNPENAKEIFNVNVMGIVNFFDALAEDFKNRRNGIIAGVSSLADARGFPLSGYYAASKAAVSILLESYRIELKRSGIKVITVKPGFVKTAMTDKNEFYMPLLMKPEKAAEKIIKGIEREKKVIRFPWPVAAGSALIKLVPDFIFDLLMSLPLPKKK
ncbi:MAG: SDR family oxidoreductase [Ignavibacteriaceae bacterium]